MKKIVSLVLFAGCVFGFVACQKETLDPGSETPAGKQVRMIINATQSSTTKTVLDGTSTKWKEGDKVTVMYKQTGKSGWFTQESGTASSSDSYGTATFSVVLTSPDAGENAYAIYPANNLTQSEVDKAKITIAATQHPTGSSFDGASDILISKPFTPGASVTTQFSRPGAVLKIKISNAALSSEKLLSLSVTGANALAGDVLVNLSDAAVSGIENGSTKVTAEYESEDQFTVGSSNYVYLIVKPQTLLAGNTLTVEGETENYTFSKAITLDKNIYLNAGHIVPLNINLTSVSHKDKVFFKETFGGNDHALGTGNATFASDYTWTTTNAYAAGSGGHSARFGQASSQGVGTTPSITIDNAYRGQTLKLYFKAAAWDGDGEQTSLSVSVSGTDATLSGDALTDGKVSTTKNTWGSYTLNIGTSANTSSITVSFQGVQDSKARFFLDDVTVYYGERPLLDAGLSYGTTFVAKVMADGSFTNTTISNPNGFDLSYSSSNTDVADVNTTTGAVTLKAKGSTRITASSAANEDYAAGSAYYDLIVTDTPVTAFSWTRSSKTDTYTVGFTFNKLYMNNSNDAFVNESGSTGQVGYVMAHNSSMAMFSSTPAYIRLTAVVASGTAGSLTNPVKGCLINSSGVMIDGTEITITTSVTTNSEGDSYVLYFPLVSMANGVKLYHEKESGKSLRYYSMTLEYANF